MKTMTNKQLRELLETFPDDATVEPYEGEVIGVSLYVADGEHSKYIGFIQTYTTREDFKIERDD